MAKNTPAFQYYPADLMADPEVMLWSMELLGCYWQMITYLWLNGGKVELNYELLRVLFRVKRQLKARKLWEIISKKFVLEDGVITHKRVTLEMQRQVESRLRRQEAGKKGGKNKAKNASIARKKTVAKRSPSSSTSTSSSTSVNKEKHLDFVLLSEDEHKKLIEKFGDVGTRERIANLNEGIGSKGYKYKSHYFTILAWDRNPAASKVVASTFDADAAKQLKSLKEAKNE